MRVRVLVLNPNTTAKITDFSVAAATEVAAPSTEIVTTTASRGVPYISTRCEAPIGGSIAMECLAERHAEVDAAIIAAFDDPGLLAAPELFDIPVCTENRNMVVMKSAEYRA
jgi:Asp/Glu/hydantoin racemase